MARKAVNRRRIFTIAPIVLALAIPTAADAAIEEIVVTAQRRDATIERVPAAVSALGAEELDTRRIDDVQNLQFAVPSLSVGTAFGNIDLAIRGVGREVGAPAVGVYVDGVYRPHSATAFFPLVDLERVEVLRGPQGTLYGRNANAGIIHFVTAAPTDERFGWAEAGYAQYDDASVEAVLNVPVSDRIRMRATVRHDGRNEGYVENTGDGPNVDHGDTTSAHVRVAFDPTDVLSLELAATGIRRDGPFEYSVFNTPYRAGFIAANPVLHDVQFPHHPWTTGTNGPSASDRTFGTSSLTATWRAPFGDVRSITAFQYLDVNRRDDRDGISAPLARTHLWEQNETFTQELTISGTSHAVNWLTGVFYLDDRGHSMRRMVFPSGLAGGLTLPIDTFVERDTTRDDTHAFALYADATLEATERFRVFAGVRRSTDELSVENDRRRGLLPDTTVVDLCPGETDYDLEFAETTVRAGAQLDVASGQHLYASFSDGFKDGGFNIDSCNDEFEPERIDAWEIGYKAAFLNGAVSVRTAAFTYDYKDFQVSQRAGLTLSITNAAAAKVDGVEIEIDWHQDEHWSWRAALTLLDARYDEFLNQDGLHPELGVQDLSGNALNDAPDTSGLIHVAYRTDPFSFGTFTAGLAAAARSKIYFREFNEPEDAQSGYTVVDAYVEWNSPNERYQARLYGNNLTKAGYFTALGASDVFGARGGTFGAPRQLGAELRVRF